MNLAVAGSCGDTLTLYKELYAISFIFWLFGVERKVVLLLLLFHAIQVTNLLS